MNQWIRRGLGILALGGGAIGLSGGMMTTMQAPATLASVLIIFPAMAFFLWGIWCGVQMLEAGAQAVHCNAIFWLVQVPIIQGSSFGYLAFCGAQIQVFLKTNPAELGFFASMFGAQFGVYLGRALERSAFGINLFAVAMVFLLLRSLPVQASCVKSD
ncbi:hypothetical protein [Duganella qianjiadongensis]|uniref:Uncharacterized protein n=1 Tax=Duganella qianjiadongensis TaxID=2692176 RepID=A0ABW9VEX2_9BURK|nr:hypothetical protein [Duganella qianjiadongensis]MYM38013.1 hypothetical protein [Duganella qianjiadongensis]